MLQTAVDHDRRHLKAEGVLDCHALTSEHHVQVVVVGDLMSELAATLVQDQGSLGAVQGGSGEEGRGKKVAC